MFEKHFFGVESSGGGRTLLICYSGENETNTGAATCSKLGVSSPVYTNSVLFSFHAPLSFLWYFAEKYDNI